jgi:hypothetical protein
VESINDDEWQGVGFGLDPTSCRSVEIRFSGESSVMMYSIKQPLLSHDSVMCWREGDSLGVRHCILTARLEAAARC